jgi:hypothetical protein
MKKINTYRLTKEEILKAIADYMEMYHPDDCGWHTIEIVTTNKGVYLDYLTSEEDF